MVRELLLLMSPSALWRRGDLPRVYGDHSVAESPQLLVWNVALRELSRLSGDEEPPEEPCAHIFACYPVHADEPLHLGPDDDDHLLGGRFPYADPRYVRYRHRITERVRQYRQDYITFKRNRRACLLGHVVVEGIASFVVDYIGRHEEPTEKNWVGTVEVQTRLGFNIFMRTYPPPATPAPELSSAF